MPDRSKGPAPKYAKVGETPGWRDLDVIDLETGTVVRDVVEVNCAEGWLVRLKRDAFGRLMADIYEERAKTEVVAGRFMLRRRKK